MKTYEILENGQIKIKEEIVTTKDRVVDITAVEKRVDVINSQISELEEELTGWEALLSSVSEQKLDATLPEDTSKVEEVK